MEGARDYLLELKTKLQSCLSVVRKQGLEFQSLDLVRQSQASETPREVTLSICSPGTWLDLVLKDLIFKSFSLFCTDIQKRMIVR